MFFEALERFLISLDVGVWGAIWRIGLGFAIPPTFRVVSGGRTSVWTLLALFLALLIGLRLGPAVLRRLLPFSTRAKAIWAERRALAKRYDSYQWRKLFWLGLGMLPYVLVARGTRPSELMLAIFCLLAGGAGQLVWRKIAVTPAVPVSSSTGSNRSGNPLSTLS